MIFVCISLVTNHVKHFFTYAYLAIEISFEKYLFKSFAHLNRVLFLFVVLLEFFIYYRY